MPENAGIDRRALVAGLTAACAGAISYRADAAPELDPRADVAFAASPAALSAEQRAAVRSSVRGAANALAAARQVPLDPSVAPAAVFFPRVPR